MKSLSVLSREMWLSGVTRKQASSELGVRDWLVDGDWVFDDRIGKNRARISANAYDGFAQASVNDALRLSIASLESAGSFLSVPKGMDERRCAWVVISIYYAAFFAANALMRFSGYSCTNLNSVECASINEMARLTGFEGSSSKHVLGQGLYFVRPIGTTGSSIGIDALNGAGGVHIQFWIGFKRFLDDLKISIKASSRLSAEKAAALKELSSLGSGLSFGGSANGSWLSEIRNSVNYRFDYGSWYPYEGSSVEVGDLLKILRAARDGLASIPEPESAVPEMKRATYVAAALLVWLKDSLETIASTSSGKKKTLVSDGALAMLSAV
ncbi:hypothetical protein [Pseudoxanthomonas japonensis]|uniref:hypothetical protein n=1 Tax=Pseudoxanthomonas japonensis TaxID=69284 RepID=UPI00374A29C4